MQIPFTAYADDCTISGELALRTDRLSDFLASTTEFDLGPAELHALDDGRVVETDSIQILRDDLCVVAVSGPRGREDRRLWTRQHPVRVRVGPYVVVGYLHAPPTIDPFHMDRRPIVALTTAFVEYVEAGAAVRVESEALLVNSAKIDVIEPASAEDVGLAAHIELPTAIDPKAKDYTTAP